MSAGTETRSGKVVTSVINTESCGPLIGGQAFIRPNVNDTTNRHLYRPASKLISLTSCPAGLALSFAHHYACTRALAGMLAIPECVLWVSTKQSCCITSGSEVGQDSELHSATVLHTDTCMALCRLLYIMCPAAAASGGGSHFLGVPCFLLLFWGCMVSCIQVCDNSLTFVWST